MARVGVLGDARRQALHLLRPFHRQRAGMTGVQLNGNSLDPAHGLVAEAATQAVSRSRLSLLPSFKLKVENFKLDVT